MNYRVSDSLFFVLCFWFFVLLFFISDSVFLISFSFFVRSWLLVKGKELLKKENS